MQYQIEVDLKRAEKLLKVGWILPIPGFTAFPEAFFRISVQLDSGDKKSILIQPQSTIAEIRSLLANQGQEITAHMKFYSDAKLLSENWTIEGCGISPQSLLSLMSKMVLNVTTPDWENLSVTVESTSTVSEVIACLPGAEIELPTEQYLLYEEMWLYGDYSLAQIGIPHGASVRIIRRITGPFVLSAELPSRKALSLQIDNSNILISALKEKIAVTEEYIMDQFCLSYLGQKLQDEMMLAYYSVAPNKRLSVELSENTIIIVIKALADTSMRLHALKSDPILAIKSRIKEKTGLPEDQQRLIFEGKLLDDVQLLAKYSIPNEGILSLVPKCTNNRPMQVRDLLTNSIITVNVNNESTIAEIKAQISTSTG